jgi:hypothetical protein
MKKKKNYRIKNRVGNSKYIDWSKIKVTNNSHMSGEDITKHIYEQTGVKITRQGVSSALKMALRKVYNNLKMREENSTPIEVATLMFQIFYGEHPEQKDAHTFFSLLPEDICAELELAADDR